MRFTIPILALSTQLALTAEAKVRVVATTPDLAALVRVVGADEVDVVSLSSASQDPHYVDPRPSLLLPLAKAELLVVNGLDLEIGWLPPLLTNSRNAAIQPGGDGYLDASLHVERLDVPASTDRSQGDIHRGGNPHYTFDPRAARGVVSAIAERLAKIDPDHAERYRSRSAAFGTELDRIAAKWKAEFDRIPAAQRKVVLYHKSLTYLLDWLGIDMVATVEPKPGIPPDPAHVAAVLTIMRKTNTPIVLQEGYYQTGPSKTLAELAQGQLVVIPGGTHFERGESYTAHVEEIVRLLHAAFTER
jgi:zinc/manganese transport system substrate-binding protein